MYENLTAEERGEEEEEEEDSNKCTMTQVCTAMNLVADSNL